MVCAEERGRVDACWAVMPSSSSRKAGPCQAWPPNARRSWSAMRNDSGFMRPGAGSAYFLNSRSNALRASLALLGGGTLFSGTGVRGAAMGVAESRATVTRGENSEHSFN